MIQLGLLSTRVTYQHVDFARQLAAELQVPPHSGRKSSTGNRSLALLDRCLYISEILLGERQNHCPNDRDFARIGSILRAAASRQGEDGTRTRYATAALHFVERTIGLLEPASGSKATNSLPPSAAFTREHQRARLCGTYSTPDFIVNSMYRELFRALERNQKKSVDVLDLSLEAGHFVLAARDWVSEGRGIFFYGIDRDPIAIELASRISDFVSRGEKLTNFDYRFACRDSLLDGLPRSWPQRYTIVIGNPPWIARKPVVSPLRGKFWPLLRGHYDLYLAFILQAHRLLKPGGYLSYVVPSGFLFNYTAAPVRRLLLEEYDILSLTSYPQRSFIEIPCIIPISFLAQKKKRPTAVSLPTRIISEDVGLGGPRRPHGIYRGRYVPIWKKLPFFALNPLARQDTEFLISALRGSPLANFGRVCSGARLCRAQPRRPSSGFLGIHARGLRPFHACPRTGQYYGSFAAVFDRAPEPDAVLSEKVVFQELRYMTHTQRLVAAVAGCGTYPVSTAALFLPNESWHVHFFAALFNSALANAWYKLRDLNRAIKISWLRELPVPYDTIAWRRIERLARQCSRLRMVMHRYSESCRMREEGDVLARRFPQCMKRMAGCLAQIDDEVFDLYGLSRDQRSVALRVRAARVF